MVKLMHSDDFHCGDNDNGVANEDAGGDRDNYNNNFDDADGNGDV